jgi:hypothetical protein
MLGPDDGRDLIAQMLGERGGGAARRDRDRDRLVAVDGGEDERAQLGHVDDVAEQGARLGIAEDTAIHRCRRGRRDDEKLSVQVLRAIPAMDDRQPESLDLREGLRRDDDDLGAGGKEPFDLLQSDAPGSDDEYGSAGQVDARHVVRRR